MQVRAAVQLGAGVEMNMDSGTNISALYREIHRT